MNNSDVRRVLYLMVASGQIERYKFPVFNEDLKGRATYFAIGIFAGFCLAFAVIL